MKPQDELAIGQTQTSAASDGALTPDEVRRLEDFLSRRHYQPQYAEWELDHQRLEFARWLVQRGSLTENMEQA